jgi:SAM-dependent methyltransferase
MFSIVKRSKREAEKARVREQRQKIRALRERVASLREAVGKLKRSRDEGAAQVLELRRQLGSSPCAESVMRRLADAESRITELEAALVKAEANPLPQPLTPPLPPPHLRRRIGANYAGVDFLANARAYSERIAFLAREAGRDLASFRSVLDWGCGCGRIARCAAEMFPGARYHGLDTDQEAIEWCREHLAEIGHFEQCSELPPAPYEDGSFDFIFALSVFTHLRLDAENQWLKELARVARPGAVLFFTYLREETVTGFGLGEPQVVDREGGFTCYASWEGEGLPYYNLTSSHTEDSLRSLWGAWFDILSIHPSGIGQQGVVLARARG